jgi:hypothetical protein
MQMLIATSCIELFAPFSGTNFEPKNETKKVGQILLRSLD